MAKEWQIRQGPEHKTVTVVFFDDFDIKILIKKAARLHAKEGI